MGRTLQIHRERQRARPGAILIEVAVAAALLAMLLTIALQVLGNVAVQRRAVERRAIALQAAATAMEQAGALPWNEVTAERLAEIELSPATAQSLKGATFRWTLEPTTSGPEAKHIRLDLTWTNVGGGPAAPVRLNYWACAPGGTP